MPSRTKVVLISQRVVEVAAYGEFRDCLDQQWAVWLESLDLLAVPVPNRLSSPQALIRRIRPDAILLSGGNNLASGDAYDETRSKEGIPDAYQERDDMESALVEYAVQESVPLLGCCRGMQFLQAYFGGRLSRLASQPVPHAGTTHPVTLIDGPARELAGQAELTVNSFHNYGIRVAGLAGPLQAVAVSPGDQTVEAFVHRTHPILGIMWHPERRHPSASVDLKLATALFAGRWPRNQPTNPTR